MYGYDVVIVYGLKLKECYIVTSVVQTVQIACDKGFKVTNINLSLLSSCLVSYIKIIHYV